MTLPPIKNEIQLQTKAKNLSGKYNTQKKIHAESTVENEVSAAKLINPSVADQSYTSSGSILKPFQSNRIANVNSVE